MPFNGSGTFVRVHDWTDDAAANIPITASRCDAEDDGFATGLSNCITRDGQSTITAAIPFNGQNITGVGDLTAGGSLTAATNRVVVGANNDGQIRFFDPSAGTNLKRSYLQNISGRTIIGTLNDAASSNAEVMSIDHATILSEFKGTIRQSGAATTTYGLDTSTRTISAANGATIWVVTNFSGLIIINNNTSGAIAAYLCGAGTVYTIGGASAAINCTYASPQNGYAVGNTGGSTGTFTIMTLRTRSSA